MRRGARRQHALRSSRSEGLIAAWSASSTSAARASGAMPRRRRPGIATGPRASGDSPRRGHRAPRVHAADAPRARQARPRSRPACRRVQCGPSSAAGSVLRRAPAVSDCRSAARRRPRAARLAAAVPPPRKHLTRYHGVFAPHAALRAAVTPAGRGPAGNQASAGERPTPRHVAMTWARRLNRVFKIDIEQCAHCGGRLKVIASIEDPEVIARMLDHRRERRREEVPVASLGPRAPPPGMGSGSLF
jgi:hypothetical protein